MVYLKSSDEKTTRVVRPAAVGEMEYRGKKYLGMRAFCLKRNEERVFRIDRILEIQEVETWANRDRVVQTTIYLVLRQT